MKKSLLFFLLIYKSLLFSQTVLNSYPLDFKRSDQNNQILNVEDTTTNDVFVFATNTQNITILKYNTALFLKDDFTLSRTNLEDKSIIGYSFSEDGNPTLYWSTEDYRSIYVIKYYLETKTYKVLSFNFPFSTQHIITTFQQNNLFYILSQDITQPALNVYAFKNGTVEEKTLDFSEFTFQNTKTQFIPFDLVIDENPIEKIESDEYNSLYKSAKKSKIYMLNKHIILTLDYNPKKTQVFDFNLNTNELTEKNFTQSVLEGPKKTSNSFFYNDKLYQINTTETDLLFDIKDYNSGKIIKSYKVSKNDTIRFKSSPLFIQHENQKPREIKKTSKFLQRLSACDIGLSVFKSTQNTLVTLGGIPKIEKIYYNLNENSFGWDYASPFHTDNVFFESTLSDNSEFVSLAQQPLALDNINYFLGQNKKALLPNTLKFKNYYILGYYDTVSKQYMMRKFTDGFIPQEPSNPIINKATFSKSFPLNKP